MNPKAKILEAYFQKEGLTFFQKHEIGDEADTVSFITSLPVGEARLLTGVITDTSIFTTVRVELGIRRNDPFTKNNFLDFLRHQNAAHALFKYAWTEEGKIYLDVCLPAEDDRFDPEMVRATLNLLVYHLSEDYPAFLPWLTPAEA